MNIGPNLVNKIPQVSKTFDQYFSPVDTEMDHLDLTLNEFETSHKSLNSNKSGIDDINSNIVLDFFNKLKTPLFYIFRALLSEELFPEETKIPNVSPLFKGDNNLKAENYRPISVLLGYQINTSTENPILELVRNITKPLKKINMC